MQVLNSDADIVTKCCSNGKNYPKPVLDVVAFRNFIGHRHVLKLKLDHANHVVVLKAEQPMSNIWETLKSKVPDWMSQHQNPKSEVVSFAYIIVESDIGAGYDDCSNVW